MATLSSKSSICTFSTDSPGFLTDESLHEAYELEIKTKDGDTVRFGELVAGKGDTVTTIVIFVRHFFCVYDQHYVRNLATNMNQALLDTIPSSAKPAQVIIIGCGDHSVIVPYTAETTDAFPIYSDGSGKIYEKLHMKRTLEGFTTPPPYSPESYTSALAQYVKQRSKNMIAALMGGPMDQQGGEWIFHRGKLRYSHRMEGANDHLTAEQLLDILKAGQDLDCRPYSETSQKGYS